jgi:hypothetical protein
LRDFNKLLVVLGTSTRDRGRDPNFFQGLDPKNISDSEPNTVATGIEIFWIATRSKILDCFLIQAANPGKFTGSRLITGRDRNIFLDRDRFLDFWVATYGSMVPNTRFWATRCQEDAYIHLFKN